MVGCVYSGLSLDVYVVKEYFSHSGIGTNVVLSDMVTKSEKLGLCVRSLNSVFCQCYTMQRHHSVSSLHNLHAWSHSFTQSECLLVTTHRHSSSFSSAIKCFPTVVHWPALTPLRPISLFLTLVVFLSNQQPVATADLSDWSNWPLRSKDLQAFPLL